MPEDFVFPGADGKPARPRSAAQLREDLARLELPTMIRGQPIEFRATRSSFASWLNEAGVPQPLIKRLLGHVRRDVTEKHYTVRDLGQMARAVLKIPAQLHSVTPSNCSAAPSGCRTSWCFTHVSSASGRLSES
jgi:integrase